MLMNTNFSPSSLEFSPNRQLLRIHIQKRGKCDLPVAELVYLQSIGNYTWLHWQNNQCMLMPRTLKYYIDQLPGESFIRLHRCCVVNLHYVDRIVHLDADRGGLLYLRSGESLPISRRRWHVLSQLLAQYRTLT